MDRRILLPFFCYLFLHLHGHCQPVVQVLDSAVGISLRGLCVVNDHVFWASGSKGTIARSVDGGEHIQWIKITGYTHRDFRDIEAWDGQTALVMAVAEPALLLKTTDGGQSWVKVFEDTAKGMFLDAMFFRNAREGIVVGDPVKGQFFLKGTRDGGHTWQVSYPPLAAREGEACFASSGTNILLRSKGRYQLVTGGTYSRYLATGKTVILPLVQGRESTGANSIAGFGTQQLAVTGGDFMHDQDTTGNCAFSTDGGVSWTKAVSPPHGYRSCIAYLSPTRLVCCGTSGADLSVDGGNHWQLLTNQSFHVVQPARKGHAVYLAGSNGKIARLELRQ